MKKINVLVLGVGGNVSQGILKAIAKSSLECRVIGACVSSESLGLYFCDTAYLCPYADSEAFMPWLIDICNKENIDIIFTGVEENVIKISANLDKIKQESKSVFVCATYEQLLIGQNKLKTCEWLKENDCNYPRFAVPENIDTVNLLLEEVGYPLLAKPIMGKGSLGIIKITNEMELNDVLKMNGYVIQEYIGDENSEYTVGCYRDKSGRTLDPIIMHRKLKYGTTVKAEIVENEIIKAEAIKIANRFAADGPLNIQLRLDKNNRPVCFELNVRFSGTTPMRAHFGFNDVEAMIKEYVLDQALPEKFNVVKGTSYRYMNEIYFEDNVLDELKNESFLDNVKKHKISIDKWGK